MAGSLGGAAVMLGSISVAALLIGCGAPTGELVGDWRGQKGERYAPDTSPTIAGTLDSVRLTVDGNRRFVLTDGGLPMQGQVLPDGTLEIRSMIGREVAPGVVPKAKVRREGSNLVLELNGRSVTLAPVTKKPQP